MNLANDFLSNCIKRFEEYKVLGDKTFDQLEDADMHFRPNEASNSIAIIIRHMHGNMMSRWTNFLTEDGEKEWRRRDDEFEAGPFSKKQLLELWQEGWKTLLDALHSLKEEDLVKTITIRKKPLTVNDAILRQLAHYSSHVGQLMYIGKMLKNESWTSLSLPKAKEQQQQ